MIAIVWWMATVALTAVVAALATSWRRRLVAYMKRWAIIPAILLLASAGTAVLMIFYAIGRFNNAMTTSDVHPALYLSFIWLSFLAAGFITSRLKRSRRNTKASTKRAET